MLLRVAELCSRQRHGVSDERVPFQLFLAARIANMTFNGPLRVERGVGLWGRGALRGREYQTLKSPMPQLTLRLRKVDGDGRVV